MHPEGGIVQDQAGDLILVLHSGDRGDQPSLTAALQEDVIGIHKVPCLCRFQNSGNVRGFCHNRHLGRFAVAVVCSFVQIRTAAKIKGIQRDPAGGILFAVRTARVTVGAEAVGVDHQRHLFVRFRNICLAVYFLSVVIDPYLAHLIFIDFVGDRRSFDVDHLIAARDGHHADQQDTEK